MKIGSWKLSIGKCKSILSQKGRTKLFCILHFSLYTLLFPNLASAQTGNCEPALGEAILDAGNVRASIYNNGGLFWRGGAPLYEVPKDGGVGAIFAAGIWVGGLIDGELRTAGARYGLWEFWAGPLDEKGIPPEFCKTYDKIWEIRTEDIVSFLETGAISTNLKNWPWYLGAPVVDGDGDPNNYNLAKGDLPELFGDQRLWWIMNDRGNVHQSTDSEPIGLEVHGSAHAFSRPGFIRNVTFYSYKLINKNPAPLTDAYFSLFSDIDLGNFDDDYVGSDSLINLGYVYNSDDDDEGGYGKAPPALGFTFLENINADNDGLDNNRNGTIDEPDEMLGASAFIAYFGWRNLEHPQTNSHYYNSMQGRLRDGSRLLEGLHGYDVNWPAQIPKKPTNFSFPGDPVARSGWTEFTPDPVGGTLPPLGPADRTLSISTGPFKIASNETEEVRLAIIWSRGSTHLGSLTELKKDTRTVQLESDVYYNPASLTKDAKPADPNPAYVLGFEANFPNPFTETTTFRYSLPQTMQVRLAVFDILGREVEILVNQQQDAGIYTVNFEAGALPSGIYLARIELDHLRFTKRMVLAR